LDRYFLFQIKPKLCHVNIFILYNYYFKYNHISPDFNRQTKYMPNTLTPEWQQTVVFMNCIKRTLKRRVLEVTVWDFDRLKTNDFMGQTIINLGGNENTKIDISEDLLTLKHDDDNPSCVVGITEVQRFKYK
ncbi:unnamed protein product, partial [Schistosoma mattheei]